MNIATSPELYWAVLSALLTSVLWIPHILQRIVELKLYDALRDPLHDVPTQAPWAQRAIRAHTNAVENLAVFGILALAVHVSAAGTPATAMAAAVYFFARVAHYFIYVIGIPWLRTPVYFTSFLCHWVLGLTLLNAL